MPFKSERQRRFLYAKHPSIARRWSAEEKASKAVDLVTLSKAVLGEHPADVEKGVGDVARGAQKFGSEVKRGYKVARSELKGARAEAGYSSGVQGFKDSFNAGLKGNAKTYRRGYKLANQAGRARGMAKLTGQPAPFVGGDIARASMARGLSNVDFRLK